MMRGREDFAVAVRRADGEIASTTESIESSIVGKVKWLDRPFLRGTLALIDAMALGIKALMYSANVAMEDASAAVAKDSPDDPPQKNRVNDIAISLTMVVGLALGVGLFVFVPILIVKHVPWKLPDWEMTALAGGIKITMFVLYVALISQMKDIRRVFQYHGAEHKTINAYEAREKLTVENVSRYSRLHVRCGTSFILIVLVVSIAVLMFIGWGNILRRFLYELVLLPLIAGISYEVIRLAGSRKDSPLTIGVLLPGLLMQRITTREPEPEMIEVAIESLQNVLDKEASRAQY